MRGLSLLLLALLVLPSCGFFKKSKPQTYTIDVIPPAARLTKSGVPVGIDVLELPPGADRRDVVVRKANHELDVRGSELWSASLEPLLLHTLAHDLAGRLPEGMVILPGEPIPITPMRGVDVIVEDLSAGPENAVTLNARWTLRVTGAPEVTHHEQIRVDVDSLASASIARGLSQAMATLADRIAAGL